jgi:hypothetical protein
VFNDYLNNFLLPPRMLLQFKIIDADGCAKGRMKNFNRL